MYDHILAFSHSTGQGILDSLLLHQVTFRITSEKQVAAVETAEDKSTE